MILALYENFLVNWKDVWEEKNVLKMNSCEVKWSGEWEIQIFQAKICRYQYILDIIIHTLICIRINFSKQSRPL